MRTSPPVRDLIYVHVAKIRPTNSSLRRSTVEAIKSGLDTQKLAALPAWHQRSSGKWVITDGNHRLQALKELGYEYAPIVEITAEEFCRLATKRETIDLMVRIPENVRVISA